MTASYSIFSLADPQNRIVLLSTSRRPQRSRLLSAPIPTQSTASKSRLRSASSGPSRVSATTSAAARAVVAVSAVSLVVEASPVVAAVQCVDVVPPKNPKKPLAVALAA